MQGQSPAFLNPRGLLFCVSNTAQVTSKSDYVIVIVATSNSEEKDRHEVLRKHPCKLFR
jgi:hypothetical protein